MSRVDSIASFAHFCQGCFNGMGTFVIFPCIQDSDTDYVYRHNRLITWNKHFKRRKLCACFEGYNVCYSTLGCDIQGFRAMGLSVQYWPRWFQDFPEIWLTVPFGANGTHLGICTLSEKILSVKKVVSGWNIFLKGELALWNLYGDKLSLCRNQQKNGNRNFGNIPEFEKYRLIQS